MTETFPDACTLAYGPADEPGQESHLRAGAQCSKSCAFTFVELLAVIATTAILAAMLLPALNRAKQHAYAAKWISNLRQIGLGLKLYVDDYAGTYPPAWAS